MKRNYFVKGAGVLLIVAALIFSSFAVTAETYKPSAVSNVKTVAKIATPSNRDDIVWDNGGIDGNQNGLSSQLDLVYPFNSQVADDFMFEEETFVTDVHWWGIFWNTPPSGPNPADFNIIFYADAGGMPTGAGMPDPTPTALVVYNMPQVMGVPTGGVEEYEYEVVLPQPFVAAANEHYWIAIQWIGNFPPQWGWSTNGNNPELLALSVQGFPLLGTAYWTVHGYGDMAFYLTGYVGQPPVPAICCEGDLNWVDVPAGGTVTGVFEVCNCGEEGSLLDYEVVSWPEWGNWTIDPITGTGIMAGDCVTITVTVVAPPEKKKTFTGSVKIINLADPDDFCIIDVSLTTPRARYINNPLFLRILERFDNLFAILKILF